MTFELRQAGPSDADHIAIAHVQSIRTLGPLFYPSGVVDDWSEGLTADLYRKAMAGGEIFFIALADQTVVGFASDYPREGTEHGTSVYVRGDMARQGIGTALLKRAETEAIARGRPSRACSCARFSTRATGGRDGHFCFVKMNRCCHGRSS